jgi:hypothetical protein
MAFFGEGTISRQLQSIGRIQNIFGFLSCEIGLIERGFHSDELRVQEYVKTYKGRPFEPAVF